MSISEIRQFYNYHVLKKCIRIHVNLKKRQSWLFKFGHLIPSRESSASDLSVLFDLSSLFIGWQTWIDPTVGQDGGILGRDPDKK